MSDIDAILGRVIKKAEAREAKALEELRAAGIAPASRKGEVWTGLHLFGIGLRLPSPGVAEIRLNLAGEDGLSWGGSWPHAGARVDAPELLNAVTMAWRLVGQAYRSPPDEPRPGTVEIVPEADGGPLPALRILHDGRSMTLSVGNASHAFGIESVIVAQVLMTVADRIAGHLPAESPERLAWGRSRAATDLPPFAMEGDEAPDTFDAETAWFAGKAGLSVEEYRIASVDVMSRQVTHHGAGTEEPSPEEWHPGRAREGVTRAGILPLASKAAAILKMDASEFEDHAVATRNSDAFQAIFYGSRFDMSGDDVSGPSPAP